MRIGRLRHALTIKKRTTPLTQDSTGAVDLGDARWETVVALRGSIDPLQGVELYNAQQTFAEVTHEVRVRDPQVDVLPSMRIEFGTRVFDIMGVTNTRERNRELVLSCKERL